MDNWRPNGKWKIGVLPLGLDDWKFQNYFPPNEWKTQILGPLAKKWRTLRFCQGIKLQRCPWCSRSWWSGHCASSPSSSGRAYGPQSEDCRIQPHVTAAFSTVLKGPNTSRPVVLSLCVYRSALAASSRADSGTSASCSSASCRASKATRIRRPRAFSAETVCAPCDPFKGMAHPWFRLGV